MDPATWAVPALAPPTPRLRIGRSRSLQAGRLPPPDWLRLGAEAPPIFPGPLITRLLALPGPGSQPRAFLSGLQRREERPDTLPTSKCILDHGTVCVRLGKPGDPTDTGTGAGSLVPQEVKTGAGTNI
ncbi:small integral membrane protein 29 isoform X4 [Rhinolophus sinicus]|uniref:small integral membrane protein 29 isoform X4 n=1 Tax=Rhinolophus sinicus TaxID=89399 RepID=UPI003D795794